jgi:hypothetical protein
MLTIICTADHMFGYVVNANELVLVVRLINMVHYCCVPTCASHSKTMGVSMFRFTKNKQLQKIWIHKMRLHTLKSKRNPVPFVVKPHTKVSWKSIVAF